VAELPPEAAIKSFPTAEKLRLWLEKNHTRSDGIWLRFFKKASGKKSISYVEAVEEALCFGWIDGQVKKYDDTSWIQRYTPRRPRSLWSKINTGRATNLIAQGRMKPAGLKQIEAAQADGRWASAYDSPGTAVPPEDFLRRLETNKKAKASFATLKKSEVYSIVFRLQTAKKPETRERRIAVIVAMLERGEKF